LLVHRQEQMSLLGFPVYRYIDVNDSEEVMRAIHLTDLDVPLDLVLHTPGGLVLAALQMARAIHKHKGKVTAFVPHYAMSGGTLIALAADEIVLDSHATLGPVDPQLGQYPAASILAAVEVQQKHDDNTLILADMSRKAIFQVETFVRQLLERRLEPVRAREAARILASGVWTHDHPLVARDLVALGLPIQVGVDPEERELLRLYPQPRGREASVEYMPGPPAVPRREFSRSRGGGGD